MFEVVLFKRGHIKEMLEQPMNGDAREFFSTVNYDLVEKLESFTGLLNGKPIICGGIMPYWRGRGSIWTVFDEAAKMNFTPVFRGMKNFIDKARPFYNRLELAVPCDFEIGIRRAKLLGFTVECERALRFLPDGKDCTLFVLFGGA